MFNEQIRIDFCRGKCDNVTENGKTLVVGFNCPVMKVILFGKGMPEAMRAACPYYLEIIMIK